MELNKKEIIEVLERCRVVCDSGNITLCEECLLYEKKCSVLLPNYALALIKQLTEENENLNAIAEQYRKQFEEAKADTVREFAERLKALLKTDYINGTIEHALSGIDQIAKEMMEGNDGT